MARKTTPKSPRVRKSSSEPKARKIRSLRSETEGAAAKAAPASSSVRLPGGARRVRITPGGGHLTYQFKGRVFTRDGAIFTAEDLGWTQGDVYEALKDPSLVIEPVKD